MLTAWQSMSPLSDQPDQDVTMTAASLMASAGCIAFVGSCLAPGATVTADTPCQARQIAQGKFVLMASSSFPSARE